MKRLSAIKARVDDTLDPKNITIKTPTPDHMLNTRELAERIKTMANDARDGFNMFVRLRNLNPEVSAKEFIRIFDSVSPNPHSKVKTISFTPTHRDKNNPELSIMVIPNDNFDVVKYVLSYGATGSEPRMLFEKSRWVPVA